MFDIVNESWRNLRSIRIFCVSYSSQLNECFILNSLHPVGNVLVFD